MKHILTAIFVAACAARPGRRRRRTCAGRTPRPTACGSTRSTCRKCSRTGANAHAGRSVDDHPITLHGEVYRHGIGTHAVSEMLIDLKGAAVRFLAVVGVDDERKGQGSVRFHVLVDGKPAADTAVLHGGDAPSCSPSISPAPSSSVSRWTTPTTASPTTTPTGPGPC